TTPPSTATPQPSISSTASTPETTAAASAPSTPTAPTTTSPSEARSGGSGLGGTGSGSVAGGNEGSLARTGGHPLAPIGVMAVVLAVAALALGRALRRGSQSTSSSL